MFRSLPRATPVALLVTFAAPLAGAQTVPTFASASYATFASPQSVVASDLNGDGFLDLATADLGGDDLSVLLANGSGGFQTAVRVPVGSMPTGLAAADLNADGHADLVVALAASGAVQVLLGDGLGGFHFASPLVIGGSPGQVTVADFNGDGRLDLLVAHGGTQSATLSFQEPLFAFSAPVSTTFGGSVPGVAVEDLDLDGKLDVAVGANTLLFLSAEVRTYLGTGAATAPVFTIHGATKIAIFSTPHSVAGGDFDQDGLADVVVSVSSSFQGSFLFFGHNDGLGGLFGVATPSVTTPPSWMACADVNVDGYDDVVAVDAAASIDLFLGDGSGGVVAPVALPVGTTPQRVAIADLQGDGRVDLAVTASGSNDVTVLTNQTPFLPGVVSYGTGTHGCAGLQGLNAFPPPRVSTPEFRVLSTNGPADSLGQALFMSGQSPGSDPFGLGVNFLIDLSSTFVAMIDVHYDAQGLGFADVPIPNMPSLANAVVFVQEISLWSTCHPSILGLSSTNALQLTIAP